MYLLAIVFIQEIFFFDLYQVINNYRQKLFISRPDK